MSREWIKKYYLKKFKLDIYWKKEMQTKNKIGRRHTQAMEECGLWDVDWEDRLC
jgi:hypothetical protein